MMYIVFGVAWFGFSFCSVTVDESKFEEKGGDDLVGYLDDGGPGRADAAVLDLRVSVGKQVGVLP